jgi:antitoxin HicB
MLRYPVKLQRDTNGTILATFPDVPGAVTFGDTREDALARALDALLAVLVAMVDDRDRIPMPSQPRRGQPTVVLPVLEEAKLHLYTAMRTAKVSKTEMARRLNCHLPQIDRLLDLNHASRLDQVEAAFRVLGKRLGIHVENEAA